jgi:hypothetical protein
MMVEDYFLVAEFHFDQIMLVIFRLAASTCESSSMWTSSMVGIQPINVHMFADSHVDATGPFTRGERSLSVKVPSRKSVCTLLKFATVLEGSSGSIGLLWLEHAGIARRPTRTRMTIVD